jgi:hypothetical protein
VFIFSFQEMNADGIIPDGAPIVELRVREIWADTAYEEGDLDTPEDKHFAYFGGGSADTAYTYMGMPIPNSGRTGAANDLIAQANGMVDRWFDPADSDPIDEMHIIDDLTSYMNVGDDGYEFGSPQSSTMFQGTRHYRYSTDEAYDTWGRYVGLGGNVKQELDCYLIRDVIRITGTRFSVSLQRAYCLAAIIETHDPNMNYWTYANSALWASK